MFKFATVYPDKKNAMKRLLSVLFLITGFGLTLSAQGFLKASNKRIVNGSNQEVILRGIGTGNWLLNEGYMMKSSDVAGTHTAFREKLTQTIGEVRTDEFYEAWLNNHFTRRDVDSMKTWGFNNVRVAMHYKWFTLPIEDEPVAGQDTWFEEGFIRIDSLLDWCADNQMYLILDLHGAPGGQGKDANISDYDPTKPSLWESAENRRKTVALWAKLAHRYVNEPWMGGYDLINEPNWNLPGNTLLRQLYVDITNAIRQVDTNHMIIIEGNWFANDYNGLTPPWDDNMVYSFHKYWTYNTQNELNWIINLRNSQNVPIWLGESGENSNSWFTDLIALCEQNEIGWAWWPVKKAGINNVLQAPESQAYNNLMNYWKSGFPVMNADEAFAAVMEWAENHKIENCAINRDVIDAMIRQPFSTETLPYQVYRPGEPIHAVNYDLGRSSFAYRDSDSANYHLNTNNFTNWNQGWAYRNDGVDIDKSNDNIPGSNGYYVGWTEKDEWLQYTIETDSAAAYTFKLHSSSNAVSPAIVSFSIDGVDIMEPLSLPSTGGFQNWNPTTVNDVILPAGQNKIRLLFERGGSNINLFSFINPKAVDLVSFGYISSETNVAGDEIMLTLNKTITEFASVPADFQLTVNGSPLEISLIQVVAGQERRLSLKLSEGLNYSDEVRISYSGSSIISGGVPLEAFSDKLVKNTLPQRYMLPAKIQAEDFYFNNGFQFEECNDIGGGLNLGFANNGDYIDYLIRVPEAGEYQVNFRIASIYSDGKISVRASSGGAFQTYGTLNVASTGGWQTWENQSLKITLPAGNLTFRLYSFAGEYNINWFELSKPTSVEKNLLKGSLQVFPNPGNGIFRLKFEDLPGHRLQLTITDVLGNLVYADNYNAVNLSEIDLNLSGLPSGAYLVKLVTSQAMADSRIIIL
jgi:hypothetical protein